MQTPRRMTALGGWWGCGLALCWFDPETRKKVESKYRELNRKTGDSAAASYCDVGVGEVRPAEQVDQSVEAGQFTARQLLAFHHRAGFHSVHVIDGSDHPHT